MLDWYGEICRKNIQLKYSLFHISYHLFINLFSFNIFKYFPIFFLKENISQSYKFIQLKDSLFQNI